MKKLKLNLNIANFLTKNKTKLYASALVGCTLISLPSCANAIAKETTTISAEKQELLDTINNVVRYNRDNIRVVKNKEQQCYVIHENVYMQRPIYYHDISGNELITDYNEELYEENIYVISYEDADIIYITNLLDAKTFEQKTKKID